MTYIEAIILGLVQGLDPLFLHGGQRTHALHTLIFPPPLAQMSRCDSMLVFWFFRGG